MVLIDSSIWIEAARRDGDLKVKLGLKSLLSELEAVLCGPVRLEVLGGSRQNERERMEHGFSCLPFLHVLDKDWLSAVEHAWQLRDAGISVPWNDILIATLAVRAKMRVYAKDKHFDSMAPVLGFTLYEPGYGGMYRPE